VSRSAATTPGTGAPRYGLLAAGMAYTKADHRSAYANSLLTPHDSTKSQPSATHGHRRMRGLQEGCYTAPVAEGRAGHLLVISDTDGPWTNPPPMQHPQT
jgi:hypothetical protein